MGSRDRNGVKKKKWGRKLVLAGILLGLLMGLENQYHVLRLVKIKVIPANRELETTVLNMTPASAGRFWPLLWLRKGSFISSIEGSCPVTVTLSLSGWGKYNLSMTPLNPVLVVVWDNRIWYVDGQRRMWQANLLTNTFVPGIRAPNVPLVHWSSSLHPPFNIGGSARDIAKSNIPVESLLRWIELFKAEAKFGELTDVALRSIEGIIRVVGLFQTKEGGRIRLIMPESTTNWHGILNAVNSMSESYNRGVNVLIDATYGSRIVVKSDDSKLSSN